MTVKALKTTLIAGSIVVGLCTGLFFIAAILTNGFECSGAHVSAGEANRNLHQKFLLPASARDINYISSVWYSLANFAMSEAEFVEWCEMRGWRITSIAPDSSSLYWRITGREKRAEVLQDGLKIEEISSDRGFKGVFDRVHQRASVQYSTH